MKCFNIICIAFSIFSVSLASINFAFCKVKEEVFLGYRALKNLVLNVFSSAIYAESEKSCTNVLLVQAKAFKAQKEKRARPVLSDGWRMCSSI